MTSMRNIVLLALAVSAPAMASATTYSFDIEITPNLFYFYNDLNDPPLNVSGDLSGVSTKAANLSGATGIISFDGTGKVECTGNLDSLIFGCNRQGLNGEPPSVTAFEGVYSVVSEDSFRVFYGWGMYGFNTSTFTNTFGESFIESGNFSASLDGKDYITGRGYGLEASVNVLSSTSTPAVPLPASLPLLLGAFGATGALARRQKMKKR